MVLRQEHGNDEQEQWKDDGEHKKGQCLRVKGQQGHLSP